MQAFNTLDSNSMYSERRIDLVTKITNDFTKYSKQHLTD